MTVPTDLDELERLAAERLDPVALEYFARGTGDLTPDLVSPGGDPPS